MSHFVTLVVTNEFSEAAVDAALARYHEFECTGEDNEYVQDYDITEESRADFEKHGKPDQSFADFIESWNGHKPLRLGEERGAEHKYGYCVVDENGEVVKDVKHTNRSAKWDWWTIGGRWDGYFKLKPGTTGAIGKPGLNRMDPDYTPPAADRADMLHKCDIDIDSMRDAAVAKAAERHDRYAAVTLGLPVPLTWPEVRRKHGEGEDGNGCNYDAAREEYNAQPAIKAFHTVFGIFDHLEPFLVPREQFIQSARDNAITPFAVVLNGEWYERGSMGWWGCVSDEKNRDEWGREFSKMFDALPDDAVITAVDCHI